LIGWRKGKSKMLKSEKEDWLAAAFSVKIAP
jgi:hypothetical protein